MLFGVWIERKGYVWSLWCLDNFLYFKDIIKRYNSPPPPPGQLPPGKRWEGTNTHTHWYRPRTTTVKWWISACKHRTAVTELNVCTVRPRLEQTDSDLDVISYTEHTENPAHSNVWCWHCVFRRPEGKFKKKQTPRDEALQILKPQMDNPPAPQVNTHTHTHLKILRYTVTVCKLCASFESNISDSLSNVRKCYVSPAQTSCCSLTFCIWNKRSKF